MAVDFPSSPTDGQKLTVGNIVYTYNAALGVWRPARLGTALPFNYIINPAFQISQQNGNGSSSASGWWVADQFTQYCSTVSSALSCARTAVVSPNGSPYSLRYSASDSIAPAAGDYHMIDMRLEGTRVADLKWGTAQAEQIVLRFWTAAYAGIPVGNSTYAVTIRNVDCTRSYIIPFQAKDGLQTFVVPGCTDGVWNLGSTTTGITIGFVVRCGTTYRAPATLAWQNGNYLAWSGIGNILSTAGPVYTFDLWDVGLYRDPNKTGRAPPWQAQPDSQAVLESERYYQKQMGSIGVALAATTTPGRSTFMNHGPMRIAPAISLVGGTMNAWDQATGPALTGISTSFSNLNSYFECNFNAATAQTAGRGTMIYGSSATTYIANNSRM